MSEEMTTTIEATGGNVRVGRLEIELPEANPSGPNVGFGTVVKLDGVELNMVRRVELVVDVDEIVTAKVTYCV